MSNARYLPSSLPEDRDAAPADEGYRNDRAPANGGDTHHVPRSMLDFDEVNGRFVIVRGTDPRG